MYDEESGLYYLESRYYDPVTGRFVNADGYVSTGTGLMGHNMFAYCNNNPVMYVDPSGEFAGFGIIAGATIYQVATVVFAVGMALLALGAASAAPAPTLPGTITRPENIIGADIVSPSTISKETDKADEKVKDETTTEPEGITYYHSTSATKAALIMSSGTMTGSVFEGGHVFAWRMRPSKYAVEHSGADTGVIISFKTNTSFVDDTGITNSLVNRYKPEVRARPGPISVWDVEIVG